MTDVLWRNRSPKEGTPTVHVLVIGVSSYDHLPGGTGEQSTAAMLSGLSQLSAAATSATRIALWIRNTFDFPNVQLGTVRLLASPSPAELPLPDDVAPPPATYDEVRRAVAGWLKDARSGDGNVSVLYVAGHGIQTSSEGGIVLLQDVGAPDSIRILERAIDVASVRLGMVADPAAADTCTPPVQYYFYDACRVVPPATAAYEELKAGVFLDIAKGAAPTTSYVLWGSSAGDYTLADPETRETLFSAAFTEALESRAPVGPDGRTVRLAEFGLALETLVAELADQHGEQQNVTPGGSGPFSTPVYLRPAARSASRGPGDPARPPPPAPSISPPTDSIAPGATAPPPSVRPPQPPPSVVDATPVAVVARASNDSHFALTFLNTRDAIVASGFTGTPTQLAPGSYRAVVQLPWGGTAEAEFDVAPGSTTMQIDVATPTEADGFAVAMPRLDRQLGPIGAGVDWSVRFLVPNPAPAEDVGPFLCSPSDTWPTMTVTGIGPDGVTLALTAHSPQLHYMQIRTADGRSVVIALPIVQYAEAESSCNVVVRASSDALGAIVRFTDPLKDTIGGYLTGGRADHVTALAPSAESMLQSKMRDPLGAALGGYALLRLNELDRLHDWPNNLAQWFDWLPDGSMIAAEMAARSGNDEAAAGHFLTGAARGVPVFSDGMSLFTNRVPQLLVDDDVPRPTRELLMRAARSFLAVGTSAVFRALTTTLDIDPPIAGDSAVPDHWLRFDPTRAPGDPSGSWIE